MSDLTTTFTNIANAIRSKTGSSDTMTPSEMPGEIAEIETPMDSINITQNGTYEPGAGRGYNQVIVEVPAPTLITKSITANGTYNASDDNADGYSQVTVAVEGFKKKSIVITPTDIASFNDGTANPMPSLEISIVPVQSGSGDPSPQNVRPISGWSGANATRCGKNMFDGSPYSAWYISNDYAVLQNHLPKDTKLIMSFIDRDTSVDVSGCYLGFIESGVTRNPSASQYRWVINSGAGSAGTNTPTSYPNKYLSDLVIYPKTQETYDKIFTRFYIQIELGSTATTYSPYQGSTLSIPFHDSSDNPITVYGGRLNVTSGELTVDRTIVDLGSLTWELIDNKYFKAPQVLNNGKVVPNGVVANLLCSQYIAVTGYSIAVNTAPDKSVGTENTTPPSVRIKDTDYTDATAFKTAMNGVQLVYELATPRTYQLTPAQVSTLLGQNNVFADCGQILQGEYFVTL